MIKQIRGEHIIEDFIAPASTAFAFNDVVTLTSGKLAKATGATKREAIVGLIQAVIASTDDNYAKDKVVAVLLTSNNEAEFEADITTGSATATSVGGFADLDDENSLDITTVTEKHFKVTNFMTATKVRGKFVPDNLNTTE